MFWFYLGPAALFNQSFLCISVVLVLPKIVNCGYAVIMLILSAAGTMKLIVKGQDIFPTINHSYVK